MAPTLNLSTRLFPASFSPKSMEVKQGQYKVNSIKIQRTFNSKITFFLLDIIDAMEKHLVDNRDYFVKDENFGVDEKKRVGRPKNFESLFGLDESFRQLMID
jgi:hypothetical protein